MIDDWDEQEWQTLIYKLEQAMANLNRWRARMPHIRELLRRCEQTSQQLALERAARERRG